jgi:addiction module HigA family antidote
VPTTTRPHSTPMIPTNRIPTHPGVILLEEFLMPKDVTQTRLAEALDIPVQRINEIVNGKRGITPDTAWLLASAFKTSPEFWMNLQTQHDLAKSRPDQTLEIAL